MFSWFNWIKPLVDLVNKFYMARLTKKSVKYDTAKKVLDDVGLAKKIKRDNAEFNRSERRRKLREQWKRDYE